MADFVTSISTISGLRSWWDSTIPSTVPSGDNYIAELDAGAYDLSAVSTTWGGKTVASGGQIIIRPATAAKITTVTRALRYQADGVHFSVPNSDVTFTTFRVTLEGLQLNGGSAGASVVLTAYSTFSKCILSNAKPAFGDIGNAIKDSVSLRDIDGSPAMYLGIAGIAENCTFIHFGTEPGLRVNSVSTVKNCAIVSIGGTSAADGSGTWDTGSTNNAFGSGTTYGASPISITASDQFENISSLAAADLRLKSGASLATAGASGVGSGADVYWQARTASYSVGAYELDAGGGTNASDPGGTGTSTGSGAGGDATGGSGTNASDPGGTGTLTGSGTGGTAAGGGSGSFTFDACENNTHSGLLSGVAVNWTWFGGSVGAITSITNGTGTQTTGGMTISGLPAGAGCGLFRSSDGTVVGYQEGTVT